MQSILRRAAVVGVVVAGSVFGGPTAAQADTVTEEVDVSTTSIRVLEAEVVDTVAVSDSEYDIIVGPIDEIDGGGKVIGRGGDRGLGVIGGAGPLPAPSPPITPGELPERAAVVVDWASDRALGVIGGAGPLPAPSPPITPGDLLPEHAAAIVDWAGDRALGVIGGAGPLPAPSPPITPGELPARAAAVVDWAGDRALGVIGGAGPLPAPSPPIQPGELISGGDYSRALVDFSVAPTFKVVKRR